MSWWRLFRSRSSCDVTTPSPDPDPNPGPAVGSGHEPRVSGLLLRDFECQQERSLV